MVRRANMRHSIAANRPVAKPYGLSSASTSSGRGHGSRCAKLAPSTGLHPSSRKNGLPSSRSLLAMTARSFLSLPRFRDTRAFAFLAPIWFSLGPQASEGCSFLSLPFFMGSRRARLALGWREAPGGVASYHEQPPTLHIVRSAHDLLSLATSGRDEHRRCGGTACNDIGTVHTPARSRCEPPEFC